MNSSRGCFNDTTATKGRSGAAFLGQRGEGGSPGGREADAEERAAKRREEADRKRLEEAFNNSPAGQARKSVLRDDLLFQINMNLNNLTSINVPTGEGITTRHAADISEVINSIASEGWDFHTFSTTFVSQRETSQDSGPASRQVTVHGHIVGTYIFTRRPKC